MFWGSFDQLTSTDHVCWIENIHANTRYLHHCDQHHNLILDCDHQLANAHYDDNQLVLSLTVCLGNHLHHHTIQHHQPHHHHHDNHHHHHENRHHHNEV